MAEDRPQTLREYLLREAERWKREAEAWESVLWTDETGVELMHLMNKCWKNAFRLRTDAEDMADRVVVRADATRRISGWYDAQINNCAIDAMESNEEAAITVLQDHLNSEGRGLPWLT